jgi:hypothetical protein
MSAEVIFQEILSLDDEERERLLTLIHQWEDDTLELPENYAKELLAEMDSTTEWYTKADFEALLKADAEAEAARGGV